MRTQIFLLVFVAACSGAAPSVAPVTPSQPIVGEVNPVKTEVTAPRNPEVVAGVSSPALRELLWRHWEWLLMQNPLFATTLGDRRFDETLSDNTAAGIANKYRDLHELHAAATKLRIAEKLSAFDAVTLQLLIVELEADVGEEPCRFAEWTVDPRSNPIVDWNRLPEDHPITTSEHARTYLIRLELAAQSIRNDAANLERGKAASLFGIGSSTQAVVKMVEAQLAEPTASWPMISELSKHAKLSADDMKKLQANAEALAEKALRPALIAYANTLRGLLGKSRDDSRVGLSHLPLGKVCYANRIKSQTGLDKSPQEIFALGEREIARINREMQVLGRKLFGTDELVKILAKLRTDKSLYFKNAQDIVKKAEQTVSAAQARLPEIFSVLPKSLVIVREIPAYEAPHSMIGYYRPPHPDGSKPGEYFINTFAPETRPMFEAQVLAFHESIPGHHLQIALSQEAGELPLFRRHLGFTAFVEGWGLYAERLARDLGLYATDLDRMGMLSFEAWRAARLVVDTGMHDRGWSRDQAEKYMLAHTALSPQNIANEVDRYIGWPGQALAYKIGQLEMFRLREKAEAALGPKFSLKEFHRVMLSGGAVSLPVLSQQVEQWISQVQSGG